MASISKEPNGRRVVQFVGPDDKRRSIRLGRVPQRSAEVVKMRVELILAAKIAGHAIDADTARWIADLDAALSDKLSAVGLIPHRAERERCTLKRFLEVYVDSRQDWKKSTKIQRTQVVGDLCEYLGAEREPQTVTVAEAENFKQWLIGRKLASSTIHKRLQVARGFFSVLKRRKLIAENPFECVRSAAIGLRDRQHFVSHADTEKLIAACPDIHWRAIVALSRYGGLRCPSEVVSLKLTDINWETGRIVVTSPKTEHLGKGTRVIPLFPELRPILMEAAELAPPGAVYVVDERYRRAACHATGWRNLNLRTTFQKIVRRAGLKPWPRLFHNMRASRETELVERFPVQNVTDWLGNTPKVALRHYLMTTDEHFEAAIGGGDKSVQNPVQQSSAVARTTTQGDTPNAVNADTPRVAGGIENVTVTRLGLEPRTYGLKVRHNGVSGI